MDAAGFGKDRENALHVPCVFVTIGTSLQSILGARNGTDDARRTGGAGMTREQIQSGLGTQWAGQDIVYFKEIDSTNRYAKKLAGQGAAHGTRVLADTQTAGRGRRGHSWISPAGSSISMTLILRPDVPPAQVAKISLLTALATANAIRRVTGLDVRIKWPNDIVAGGRKVCGMLMEMDATPEKVASVVAGVGINVHQTQFPEEIAHSASSLDLLAGRRISRADIVRAFLQEYERVWALGDEAMMRAYRERSATIGQRVQVIGLNGTYTGTAQDVTESGSLLVRADEDGGVREVLAADVSVRGIMGYA